MSDRIIHAYNKHMQFDVLDNKYVQFIQAGAHNS